MTQNRLVASFLKSASALALLTTASAYATPQAEQTTISTHSDRQDLELVVYQGGIAQIKDVRTIKFVEGLQRIHIEDVASSIIPQTSLFQAANINQLEQNYDFDLLTAQKLLEKAVGSTVWVTLQNPVTGEETREQAEVLSANGNAILKMADRIEVLGPTFMPGRISFDQLPENLRAKPTLSLLLDNENASPQDTSLTYLAGDIRWSADYVATLNKQETEIDLKAWVTINNQSGMTFENATIHVVAGEVNLTSETEPLRRMMSDGVEEIVVMASRIKAQEAELSDIVQYTIPFKTSVSNNQQKQLRLFQSSGIPIKKLYVISGAGVRGHNKEEFQSAQLVMVLENSSTSGVGRTLPAGTFRVYSQDQLGAKFIGEDNLDNTPVDRVAYINYGSSYKVTSRMDVEEVSKECWLLEGREQCVRELNLTIGFKNDLSEEVMVDYFHRFYQNFEIISSSVDDFETTDNRANWQIPITANGEKVLTVKVKVGALSQKRLQPR